MNARDYKLFRPGYCYHVYNRGNNKEPIFLDNQDYLNFLKRLKLLLGMSKGVFDTQQRIRLTAFIPGSFSILCYCLMPNHFHFLIKQNSEIGISLLMQRLSTSYAKFFNKKYERVGNLFQDHFKAKLVDSDEYLTYVSAYIHNNPQDPIKYEYSSFKDYIGFRKGEICDKEIILNYFDKSIERYKQFVLSYSEKQDQLIKHLTFDVKDPL